MASAVKVDHLGRNSEERKGCMIVSLRKNDESYRFYGTYYSVSVRTRMPTVTPTRIR